MEYMYHLLQPMQFHMYTEVQILNRIVIGSSVTAMSLDVNFSKSGIMAIGTIYQGIIKLCKWEAMGLSYNIHVSDSQNRL